MEIIDVFSFSTSPLTVSNAVGLGIPDDEFHERPAQAGALQVGAHHHGVFAGLVVRVRMQANDTQEVIGFRVDAANAMARA